MASHKLSKRPSPTTVLFRTPVTQMIIFELIIFNQGMLLLGSNHFLIYGNKSATKTAEVSGLRQNTGASHCFGRRTCCDFARENVGNVRKNGRRFSTDN